jgi:hypothetical protein
MSIPTSPDDTDKFITSTPIANAVSYEMLQHIYSKAWNLYYIHCKTKPYHFMMVILGAFAAMGSAKFGRVTNNEVGDLSK